MLVTDSSHWKNHDEKSHLHKTVTNGHHSHVFMKITILAENQNFDPKYLKFCYVMPIFKSFPEIEISPNYEIAYFGNVRLELVFASFVSLRVFVFGFFTKWIIVFPSGLAVEYFPPCWRGWIQFGAKFGIGLDLRIFKGFQDTFQNRRSFAVN